jgi:hypothetical protein
MNWIRNCSHRRSLSLRVCFAPGIGLFSLTLLLLSGCGHRYIIVGESDTSKAIAVSIMKTGHGGPQRLYYTELTGNDTEFTWDRFVDDREAQVEAWFTPKNRPSPSTIYTLPPDKHVRLKLDIDDDRVVVEETKLRDNKLQFDD